MTAVIFANCAVVDGTRRERREDHHVLVEGGQIREVSGRPISSATAETVDLKGRTLMPGLIDAHVHVIAVDQILARLSERPVSLVTLQAARVLEGMLRRGFTTIRDAGGADGGLAEAVEEGLVRGPRIFPSGQALSQTGGHGDLRPRTRSVSVVACACCEGGAGLARIADGVAECRRAARDELRKGATQIKIMASGGVASPYDPVWNLQYSEEEVRAIVEEARGWHTYVMAHAYSPEAIRRSIDFGVRSIEHGNLIDRATAEHVAGADAFIVPTLAEYPGASVRRKRVPERRAQGLQARAPVPPEIVVTHPQGRQHGANTIDQTDPLNHQFLPFSDAPALILIGSSGIGTIEHTRGSPRDQASSVRESNSASIPSDFARRARRSTGTLEGWTTGGSTPCRTNQRASQNPDRRLRR